MPKINVGLGETETDKKKRGGGESPDGDIHIVHNLTKER